MTAALGAVEIDINLRIDDLARRIEQGLRRPAKRAADRMERDFARAGRHSGDAFAREFARQLDTRLRDTIKRQTGGAGAEVDLGLGEQIEQAKRQFAEGLGPRGQSGPAVDLGLKEQLEQAKRQLEDITRREQIVKIDADTRAAQERLRELEQQRAIGLDVDADLSRVHSELTKLAARRTVLELQARVDREGVRELGGDLRRVEYSAAGAVRGLAAVTGQAGKLTLMGAAAGGALAAVTSLATGVAALGAVAGKAAGSIGLLPAAAAGLAAGAATAKLAVSGLDDALSNLDDADALAKSLERLAPSAREFVRAVQRARPAVEDMRLDVQQRAFDGLGATLDDLAGNYLPRARRLFGQVADAMNRAARESGAYLNSQQGLTRTEKLVGNLGKSWDLVADAAQPAVQALLDITSTGSDQLPRLSKRVADLSERFADYVREAQESGKLAQFFEDSIDAANQLGRIVGDVGRGIANVFGVANDAGAGLVDRLEELTTKFADWTGSDEGAATLGSFFESMEQASAAVLPVIGAVVDVIANDLAPLLGEVAERVGPGAVEFVKGLGAAIGDATPGIVDFAESFGDLLTRAAPLLDDVGAAVGFLAESLGTLVGWVSPVVGAFADLNDSMGGVPLKIAAVVAGVYALNRAFSVLSLSSGLRGLSKRTRNELDGVGREVDRAGRDVEKKGRSFGQRLGSGLTKGVKALPVAGAVAAVLNETIELTDAKTGEVVGLIDAIGLGLGRAWDAVASAFEPEKVAGQAESVVDRYGEAFARLPDEVRAGLMELDATFSDAYLFHEEAGRELVRQLAEGYLAGTEQVRFAVGEFWSGMALDAQTGTTNMNTAVTGAMTTMQAVMTGGLSALQLTNRSAWEDIYTMTSSTSLSASEAVRGAIGTARVVMSGGLAGMVSDTSTSWAQMRRATVDGANKAEAAARSAANDIEGVFGGLPGRMMSVGQDMMAGLKMGIAMQAAAVAAQAGNVVGMAVAAAKAAARSHSPSLEMMDLGRDMGAGLVIGMQRSTAQVTRAAERLSYAAMDPFAATVGATPSNRGSTPVGGGVSRSVVINQNNYSNGPDARAVGAWALAGLQTAIARAGA